ncbi:helix-turn-helix transcriptional regulator [Facklamia sp. DSM 111018]|uniref:Helix-turn-helix transcriptional regulator n=1 Tax=Facklamia lactis TaxID=2749967 RepID=A0ABS0LPS9_9LACT|nr:helix-turn-helix transcriptional regulator [Facklamia lactis]MBG9980340.1 helix-turn-helix transcriptional regulator [Facklamia lactis]MBG9986144.1 helix-turn-helix transcriptional regulator [Facklamia lactis]
MTNKNKLDKKYAPMTETAFYILLNLKKENHGYNITKEVLELTNEEVHIGAGTMYGSLGKFEKDGLIQQTKLEENRKYYTLTDLGRYYLEKEIMRIKRVYQNIQ